MKPIYFKSADEFRQWLAQNHLTQKECYVGYYKVKTGKPTMSWSASVDQAICFGWIDGIRRRVDEERYQIRFTPRKADSIWSAVNIKKVAELKAKGLMKKAGLESFEKRRDDKSSIYAFEQKLVELSPEYLKAFQQNKKAWAWFKTAAPSYQKTCIWWVMSAKQEVTRLKRLGILIDCSGQEIKIPSQCR